MVSPKVLCSMEMACSIDSIVRPFHFCHSWAEIKNTPNYLQRLVDQLLGIYNLSYYILWQEQNLNTIKFKQGKKEILKKFEKLPDGQTKLNNSLDLVIKTKGHKNRFQSNIGRHVRLGRAELETLS